MFPGIKLKNISGSKQCLTRFAGQDSQRQATVTLGAAVVCVCVCVNWMNPAVCLIWANTEHRTWLPGFHQTSRLTEDY